MIVGRIFLPNPTPPPYTVGTLMAPIFVPSERHPHFNACLNYFSGLGSMEAACDGYRDTVKVLLTEVLERNGIIDTLFYAIVFNWRHYLELRLKIIYLIGRQLFDDDENPKIPPHHRLDEIWRAGRRFVRKRFPEDAVRVRWRASNVGCDARSPTEHGLALGEVPLGTRACARRSSDASMTVCRVRVPKRLGPLVLKFQSSWDW